MKNYLFQIITLIGLNASHEGKRNCRCVRKCVPHNHVDLPPLVSIEDTGVYIPTGNNEVLISAVYKSPGHAWNDTDIIELLSFRHKSLLAGDLNAKHTF
jgi:hypothetical protein